MWYDKGSIKKLPYSWNKNPSGVPKVVANAILDIEKIAEGRSKTVETEADWKLIEALFKYWAFVNNAGL